MNYTKHNGSTTPVVFDNGDGSYKQVAMIRENAVSTEAIFYRTLDGVSDRFTITNANVLTYRPTVADVATGGSLLANTTYHLYAVGGNQWGVGRAVTTAQPAVPVSYCSVTTANDASNTHVARLTIPQIPAAEFYDIHIGTTATTAPFIARITEAQRLAGCTITALRTISATTPGTGIVDVRVVGTGAAIATTGWGCMDFNSIPEFSGEGYSKLTLTLRLRGAVDYASTYGGPLKLWFYSDVLSKWVMLHITSNLSFTSSRKTIQVMTAASNVSLWPRMKVTYMPTYSNHLALPTVDIGYILS